MLMKANEDICKDLLVCARRSYGWSIRPRFDARKSGRNRWAGDLSQSEKSQIEHPIIE